jgi:teichuronic acid biosynthesis protein TuaE
MDRLDTLFKALSAIFIIELLIALLESFSAFRMPISRYSKWASIFGKVPQDNFEFGPVNLLLQTSPPTGFHWDTNDLALAMLLILPFFMVNKKTVTKVFGITAIITITAMASSRSVFFGLITVFLVYFFFIKKKVATIIVVLGLAFVVILGTVQLQTSENPRLNELANSFEIVALYATGQLDVDNSLKWRFELARNGIGALIKSKGLGVGAGGSVAIQEKIGGVAGRFTSMHNFWIEILVEAGILFFILFSAWYIAIIINLYKILRNIKNQLSIRATAIFLSMVGFIPAALAASSTVYFFPMWIMLGLSIAIINLNNSLIHN